MNTLLKKLAVVATASTVLSLVGAGDAFAFSITNSRPVTIGTSGEQTLQSALDGVDADVNVNTNQSKVALWDVNSFFTSGSSATLTIEIAGFKGKNTFGIYDPLNPQISASPNPPGTRLTRIFEGDDVGSPTLKESAKIAFNSDGKGGFNVTITEISGGPGGSEGGVTTGKLKSNLFGFYLGVGSTYYYTDDTENGVNNPSTAINESARALVFEGNNDPLVLPGAVEKDNTFDPNRFNKGTDWLIAFEDKDDFDYNDMVVKVGGVGAAVPEPLTMLGAGAAAGFGAFFKRQTAKKQKKGH